MEETLKRLFQEWDFETCFENGGCLVQTRDRWDVFCSSYLVVKFGGSEILKASI